MSLASRGKREQAVLWLLAHLSLQWEPGSHGLCGRRAAGALSLLEGRGLHCPLLLEGLSVAAPVQGEQLVSVGVHTAGKELRSTGSARVPAQVGCCGEPGWCLEALGLAGRVFGEVAGSPHHPALTQAVAGGCECCSYIPARGYRAVLTNHRLEGGCPVTPAPSLTGEGNKEDPLLPVCWERWMAPLSITRALSGWAAGGPAGLRTASGDAMLLRPALSCPRSELRHKRTCPVVPTAAESLPSPCPPSQIAVDERSQPRVLRSRETRCAFREWHHLGTASRAGEASGS